MRTITKEINKQDSIDNSLYAQSGIHLTDRELKILNMISYEYSEKEMGKELFLSRHTVHTYRKNLMTKLNVRKSTGLVRRGFELGLLNKVYAT